MTYVIYFKGADRSVVISGITRVDKTDDGMLEFVGRGGMVKMTAVKENVLYYQPRSN